MHLQIGLCNLTPTFVRIILCFKCLNERYHARVGLSEFRLLYTSEKALILVTSFGLDQLFGRLLTSPTVLVRTRIGREELRGRYI